MNSFMGLIWGPVGFEPYTRRKIYGELRPRHKEKLWEKYLRECGPPPALRSRN